MLGVSLKLHRRVGCWIFPFLGNPGDNPLPPPLRLLHPHPAAERSGTNFRAGSLPGAELSSYSSLPLSGTIKKVTFLVGPQSQEIKQPSTRKSLEGFFGEGAEQSEETEKEMCGRVEEREREREPGW